MQFCTFSGLFIWKAKHIPESAGHFADYLLLSAHIFTQRGAFFYVYFPNVQPEWPEANSEFENFLSPNYSKNAVKCDWNSNLSQILTEVFFEEKLGFLLKKNLIFLPNWYKWQLAILLKIAYQLIFFLENVFSTLIVMIFCNISANFYIWNIYKVRWRKNLWRNVFIFSKGIFSKIGDKKICRWQLVV